MDKVGECRGDRGGNVYHVYDGYFYRINHNDSVRKYLACVKKGCPGRASMPADLKERILNNFRMTGLHSHPPNMNRLALSRLKEVLINRSESELTPIRQIYLEEIEKVPEEVADMLRYRVYRSTMQRCRKLVQQAIINSLQQEVDSAELDYEENPGDEYETEEYEEQQDTTAQRKRAGPRKFLRKSDLKKRKLHRYTDEEEYLEEEGIYQENGNEEYAEYYYEDENEATFKTENDKLVFYEDEETVLKENDSEIVKGQSYEGEYILGMSNNNEEANSYSNFLVENEVEIGTSEIITDSAKKSPAAKNSLKKTTKPRENCDEDRVETFKDFLKFSGGKSKINKNNPGGDLLATFFREVEDTVRSFLPSVIIEAKGKIANLINKLEMRNWQVKKLLREKEREQMEQLKKMQTKPPQICVLGTVQQPPDQQKKQTQQQQPIRLQVQQIKQVQPPPQPEITQDQEYEQLQPDQPTHEEETPHDELQDSQQTYKLEEPIPVVLKYGPNVSVICLPNEVSAFSQPLLKVREIASLQEGEECDDT